MSIYENIFNLYNECLPHFPVEYDTFVERLNLPNKEACKIFTADSQDGDLIAAEVVNPSSLSLLLVKDGCRGMGIGREMFKLAESYMKVCGYNEISIGRGHKYLFQGVPEEAEGAVHFFEKLGCKSEWTSCNMIIDTKDLDTSAIPKLPSGIAFRLAVESDRDAMLKAVTNVDISWLPIFETCAEPVLLAVDDGEIVGFEILSEFGSIFWHPQKTGSIGCVGVVERARCRGIGLRMVAEGVKRLSALRCRKVELEYVEYVSWYSKIGFRKIMPQRMMTKSIGKMA